jgi:uncharacterized protein
VTSAAGTQVAGAPREPRPAARVRARISWHEYFCRAQVSTTVIRLDSAAPAEPADLPAERLLEGTPQLRVRNFFTDPSQQFFAGRWTATRGKWRVRYTENELCVMTSGRVALESAGGGERCTFGPGDAFVVPAGFIGTWEVLEDCSKIYAVFEARS